LLENATEQHRAGNLADARRLYSQVLAAEPNHTLALFRSGLLELQDQHPAAALALMSQAAAADPGQANYLLGVGQALQALGRPDEAAGAYRRVLSIDPDSADACRALGDALYSQRDYSNAIAAYESALHLRPDSFDALNNLGICRQRSGQLPQAAAAYRHALALRPGNSICLGNLGAVLREMGDIDEAIELLRAAVGVEPQRASHGVNLAIALCQRRDFAAAASLLRETLVHEPNSAEAAFNLGNALHGLGQSRDAVLQYRRALQLRPSYAEALNNLGNVYKELGEFSAALAAFEAAIRLRSDDAIAMNNLGCLLRTLGRIDEAEDILRRGLAIDPRHAALHDNLGNVLKDAGELDEAIDLFRKALDIDPGNPATHSNLAYALSFQAAEARPILAECARWNERFAAPLYPEESMRPLELSADRRLKVGYVSPDFRDHCQSLFTVPLFSHHDRASFEVFCYSSVARPDEYTRRISSCTDVWRDVRTLSDAALCDVIREDRIDILVDLTMHMANGRPLVFARKPAPVQIAWLAYPGTTGISTIQYRLTDPRLDPDDFNSHYSETTLRLADSFWCYDPLTDQPDVNPLPALERGYLTLGCLNNPCKLTNDTLQLWHGVMRALPNARLLLMAPAGRHRQRLLQRLAAFDIAAQRVDFVEFRPRVEYLRSYHDIDFGLDTIPYNGHTTSLDALWMGVPVVTRVGRTCVGRGGHSQLFHLDLPDLAAETDAAFVSAAVALGNDLQRLAKLRGQLRARLQGSPLMDAGRFARNIEHAYRQAWDMHGERRTSLHGTTSCSRT
jgi:protein O-GlcNAc transferase